MFECVLIFLVIFLEIKYKPLRSRRCDHLVVGSGSISFEGSSVKSRCLLKWRRPHISYTDPATSLKEQLRSWEVTARQRVTAILGQICSATATNVFTSQFIRRHLYTNESLLSVAPPFVGSHLREKVVDKAANANFSRSGMGLAHWARRGIKKAVFREKSYAARSESVTSRTPIPVSDRLGAWCSIGLDEID